MYVGNANLPPAVGEAVTPGEAHQLATKLEVPEHFEHEEIHAIVSRFVAGKTWRTRTSQEQQKAATVQKEFLLGGQVKSYVDLRGDLGIGAGGLANLQRQLSYLCDLVGAESDSRLISSKTLDNLQKRLLADVGKKRFTKVYAHGIQASVKTFIQWLWEVEVLAQLPRNLSSKSFKIIADANSVEAFGVEAVRKIYSAANEQMKLYILLDSTCSQLRDDTNRHFRHSS